MRNRQEREVYVLLPNKEQLYITVGVKARGQDVFSHVSDLLGVKELHFFGLSVLRDCEHLFLDLDQKLTKYFGKKWNRKSFKDPVQLFLRVQHYIESGRLIQNSKALTLYYADLRQRVLQALLNIHQEDLFFKLAAYALQVDVGDITSLDKRHENERERESKAGTGEGDGWKEEQGEERRHYFLPEDYFPSWVIKRRGRDYLLQHVPVLHADLRGVSRRDATLLFIKETTVLQDVPVISYRMSQGIKDKCCVFLGVSLKGVLIHQELDGEQTLLYDLSWFNIDRFTFQRRRFELSAMGFPKLQFYTPSVLHSTHILRHLSDAHRLHMNTRASVALIRSLEESHVSMQYQEAYICDRATLGFYKSPLTPRKLAQTWPWPEDEENGSLKEFELCVDEPEEVSVDNPEDLMWLAEWSEGVSVDGPVVMAASPWADVAMEMKQVLQMKMLNIVCV